jgi:hypothetical protein
VLTSYGWWLRLGGRYRGDRAVGKHKVSFVSGFVWRFGGDYFSGGDYFFQRVANEKKERLLFLVSFFETTEHEHDKHVTPIIFC